jgi:hypothetical protein
LPRWISFEKYVGFYAIVGEKPKDFADFAIISFDAGLLTKRMACARIAPL